MYSGSFYARTSENPQNANFALLKFSEVAYPRPKTYGRLWLRSVACGYYPYFLIIPIGRGYRMGAPGNRTGAHSGLERRLVGVRWGR